MTLIPNWSPFPAVRGAAAAALAVPLAILSPGVARPAPPQHVRATPSGVRASPLPARASPLSTMVSPPPSLSIDVSDGRKSARPGDVLGYLVPVRDSGSAGIAALTLTQALPPGFAVLSASGGGAVRAGKVTWKLSLHPEAATAFRVSGRVGPVPSQLVRLATIAGVTAGRAVTPVVCAADSDALPPGAPGGRRVPARGASAVAGRLPRHAYPAIALATTAALVLLLGALVALGRRRVARGRRRRGMTAR